MHQRKRSIALGAAVLLATTSGAVVAHGGGEPMRGGMHGHDGGGPGHMRSAGPMHGPERGGPRGPHGRMMGAPGMMHGHGGMVMMMGGMRTYVAGVLGLNEEQEARIEQIQQEAAQEHWDLVQRMRERQQAFMEVHRQADPVPEALGEAYAGVSEVRRQMVQLQARVRRDVRGVLDDEQRQRFDQMRRMHARHH